MLLADRHALFREAVRTVLESEAEIHVVAEARNGLEAISEAERTLPHVAILDVDLPMSDGSQTTAAIKANVPRCQVLVLSAREDYRSLMEVLDAGASGYITRESPLADLIHATRAVHRGDTLVPPTMLGPLLTGLLRRKRDQDRAFERIARLTIREREVLAHPRTGIRQRIHRASARDQSSDRPDAHPEHPREARGPLATRSRGVRDPQRDVGEPRQSDESAGVGGAREDGHG